MKHREYATYCSHIVENYIFLFLYVIIQVNIKNMSLLFHLPHPILSTVIENETFKMNAFLVYSNAAFELLYSLHLSIWSLSCARLDDL